MATSVAERHVLVINDSVEILDLLRDVLEEEGYRVSLALSVLDLAEIRRIAPDLIVLDFAFGSEHLGLELLQKLRLDRVTAPIPVVVCSAALEAIRQMEGHLLGKGTGLVLKPFDVDELLAEIDHAWSLLDDRRRSDSADLCHRVLPFPGPPRR